MLERSRAARRHRHRHPERPARRPGGRGPHGGIGGLLPKAARPRRSRVHGRRRRSPGRPTACSGWTSATATSSAVRRMREVDRERCHRRVSTPPSSSFHNAYGPDKAWYADIELSGGGCSSTSASTSSTWRCGCSADGDVDVADASGRLFAGGRPLPGGGSGGGGLRHGTPRPLDRRRRAISPARGSFTPGVTPSSAPHSTARPGSVVARERRRVVLRLPGQPQHGHEEPAARRAAGLTGAAAPSCSGRESSPAGGGFDDEPLEAWSRWPPSSIGSTAGDESAHDGRHTRRACGHTRSSLSDALAGLGIEVHLATMGRRMSGPQRAALATAPPSPRSTRATTSSSGWTSRGHEVDRAGDWLLECASAAARRRRPPERLCARHAPLRGPGGRRGPLVRPVVVAGGEGHSAAGPSSTTTGTVSPPALPPPIRSWHRRRRCWRS